MIGTKCEISFDKYPNEHIADGQRRVVHTNVTDCANECLRNYECTSFDWNPIYLNGYGYGCWLHGSWSLGHRRTYDATHSHYQLIRRNCGTRTIYSLGLFILYVGSRRQRWCDATTWESDHDPEPLANQPRCHAVGRLPLSPSHTRRIVQECVKGNGACKWKADN